MKPIDFEDLTCCPFCGSGVFYEKEQAYGNIEYNSRFDGEEAKNYDMYEGLSYHSSGRCYCRDCDKYLGNIINGTVGKDAQRVLRKTANHADKRNK